MNYDPRPLYIVRRLKPWGSAFSLPWVVYLNVGQTFALTLGYYRTWREAIDALWALDMHRAMAVGPRLP